VVALDPDRGIVDQGIQPLAHFVDAPGPEAVAVTVETDDRNEIRPAVYCRRGGTVEEYRLEGNLLHDFETAEHRAQLAGLLEGYLG
jgi:hypothetical protein